MGVLRLLLALSVVLSHLGTRYTFAGALAAVQLFYIVSGFYMETVLRQKYNPRTDLALFYASRGLRIYSVYFACLAVSLLVYAALFREGQGLFAHIAANAGRLTAGARAWLAFVTLGVFGQDTVLFQKIGPEGLVFNAGGNFGPDPENALLWKFMAVPQAWSISLELMFYLLVPFLTRLRTPALIGVAAASLALRLAVAAAGYAGDPWIYRFFPTELALFAYGMLARRFHDAALPRIDARERMVIAWSFVAACCLMQPAADALGIPRTMAVWPLYAAALVGLPCLFSISGKADARIADLSFPVYLIHWIVIVAYGAAAPALLTPRWMTALQVPACVALSLAAGWAVAVLVERPVDRFRHALRTHGPAKPAFAPGAGRPRRAVDAAAPAFRSAGSAPFFPPPAPVIGTGRPSAE